MLYIASYYSISLLSGFAIFVQFYSVQTGLKFSLSWVSSSIEKEVTCLRIKHGIFLY